MVRIQALLPIHKGRVAVVAAAQRQHLGVFPVHVVDIVHQVVGRDEVRGAVARIGHLQEVLRGLAEDGGKIKFTVKLGHLQSKFLTNDLACL